MWDHEVDIAVIGFGGAGAAAAITAFDAGAKVIILEKNSSGGGNTQYSGGSIRTYLDVEKAVTFIENVCEGTTGRDVAESFVNESSQQSRLGCWTRRRNNCRWGLGWSRLSNGLAWSCFSVSSWS